MTDKTQDQITDELQHILGSHTKIDAIFDNALYFHYYSEITEYDIEKLNKFEYSIKGIAPKMDSNQYPYLQVYLSF